MTPTTNVSDHDDQINGYLNPAEPSPYEKNASVLKMVLKSAILETREVESVNLKFLAENTLEGSA